MQADSVLNLFECLPLGVAKEIIGKGLLPINAQATMIGNTLITHAAMELDSVRQYVSYLKICLETSCAVAEIYDLSSPPGSEGKKQHMRHTGPADVMQIANYLYVLDSYGVPGVLLECGTSHGYSSCCLSHACAMLGRKLYTADSFEGLPSTSTNEPFFEEGDYASSLESVKKSIHMLGRPDTTTYVRGWFMESLKNWEIDLALLWVDVDLYNSAKDVVTNTLAKLSRKSGFVVHEFTDFHNRVPPRDVAIPPNAIYDVLETKGIVWDSVHLHRYLGAILFKGAVAKDSFKVLPGLMSTLQSLDMRSRVYQELCESRTVRWAFALKKRFLKK